MRSAWAAPGDQPHVYAVYVDDTDKVWVRPNVRQIHGRKGEVWTPESGADKIVVYRYP